MLKRLFVVAVSFLLFLAVAPLLGVGTGMNVCYLPNCVWMDQLTYDSDADGQVNAAEYALAMNGDADAYMEILIPPAASGIWFNVDDDAVGVPDVVMHNGVAAGTQLGQMAAVGPVGTGGISNAAGADCIARDGSNGIYHDTDCSNTLNDGENHLNYRHECVTLRDFDGVSEESQLIDGYGLWMHGKAVTITRGWCLCSPEDTCTATATFVFEDSGGVDMTGTITCDGDSAGDAVTASNALTLREMLAIDVGTAGDGDGDDYVICWEWTQDN